MWFALKDNTALIIAEVRVINLNANTTVHICRRQLVLKHLNYCIEQIRQITLCLEDGFVACDRQTQREVNYKHLISIFKATPSNSEVSVWRQKGLFCNEPLTFILSFVPPQQGVLPASGLLSDLLTVAPSASRLHSSKSEEILHVAS